MMRFLTGPEYNSILLVGLKRIGLSEADAARLIAARWPMDAYGLVAEAHGRGLAIQIADIAAWLVSRMGPTWPDGEPTDAESAMFSPTVAEVCLQWCVATGRANSTLAGRFYTSNPRRIEITLQAAKAKDN